MISSKFIAFNRVTDNFCNIHVKIVVLRSAFEWVEVFSFKSLIILHLL